MKSLKNILYACLSVLFLFSCGDNSTDSLSPETSTQELELTSRSDCHTTYANMNLSIPFANNECMNNAHTRLERAIANYDAKPSDYNLYLVFNYWMNYYRTAVDCFGCEATNCTEYLATGQAMIDCLIACDSPNVAALQDIYSWVEGNCADCKNECCPDLTISASSTPADGNCCAITFTINNPSDCNIVSSQNEFQDWIISCPDRYFTGSNFVTYTVCCEDKVENSIRWVVDVEGCDESIYSDWVSFNCD